MSVTNPEKIREEVKKLKGLVSHEDKILADRQINKKVIAVLGELKGFLWGKHVGVYRPTPSEVEPTEMIQLLEDAKAIPCYPKITDTEQKRMEMIAVPNHTEATWEKDALGMETPSGEHTAVDPTEVFMMLVPGVAFGKAGERIGRGEGYFDRYLARARQAYRLGIAYDFQIFEKIDKGNWDQDMDWLVTPNLDLRFSRIEGLTKIR